MASKPRLATANTTAKMNTDLEIMALKFGQRIFIKTFEKQVIEKRENFLIKLIDHTTLDYAEIRPNANSKS